MKTVSVRKKAPAKRVKPARQRSQTPWKVGRTAGLQVLQVAAFSKLDWLAHGFSSKPGGASELPAKGKSAAAKVLNLGFTEWDARDSVLQNRKKFFQAIGASKMRPVTLKQIHSDSIRVVTSAKIPNEPAKGDALITRTTGLLLTVQVADCVPILLADTKNRAVAAIHSGWRGTLNRIAEKALGRMRMEFGTDPEQVLAGIGPCIGACCYEVGTDVAMEFASQFPNAREWFEGPFDKLASGENDPNWLPWLTMRPPGHPPPEPKVQLNLIAANRWMLQNAGVPASKILSSDFCTSCRTDLFFSYRREQMTGRSMAVIGIK
jgi:YfiH family protein